MTTANVRALQAAHPLTITTFKDTTNIAALVGIDEVTFTFEDDIWDLSTHPEASETSKHGRFYFSAIPERYRPLMKMITVARLNPQAVADRTGSHSAEDVLRTIGLHARAGNPGSAQADLRVARTALRILENNHLTVVTKHGWGTVVEKLTEGFTKDSKTLLTEDGEPAHVAKNTVRRRIDIIAMIDRFGQLLGDTALRQTGVFGSRPFNGQGGREVIPLDADEASGVNKVMPNPAVFEMFGFTAHFIATYADDIIRAAKHFHTRNSEGTRFVRALPPLSFDWHEGAFTGEASRVWSQRLMDACFFDIAVSFALRPRDIAVLDRSCVQTDAAGRQFIRAWRTKNVGAVETRFPAMPKAVNTIKVVNRLLDAHHITRSETPKIKRLPKKDRRRLFTHHTGRGKGTITWQKVNFQRVQAAARDLHDWGLLDSNLDGIENITMREMRVTALAHYADREFGTALAALFAKHASKGQLSGYIGHVQQALLVQPDEGDETIEAEIEDIKALIRPFHLLQAARRDAEGAEGENEGLLGNGLTRFDWKRNDPELEGVFVKLDTDRHLLRNKQPFTKAEHRKIAERNQNVESSVLTLCLFEPGTALCGGKGSADFRLCQPNACANSVTSPGNRAITELERRVAKSCGDPMRVLDGITEAFGPSERQDYPGIEAEFESKSDEELAQIYLEEADELVRLVMDHLNGESS